MGDRVTELLAGDLVAFIGGLPSATQDTIVAVQLSLYFGEDRRRPKRCVAYDTHDRLEAMRSTTKTRAGLLEGEFDATWWTVPLLELNSPEWDAAIESDIRDAGLWYPLDLKAADEDAAGELDGDIEERVVDQFRGAVRVLHQRHMMLEALGREVLIVIYVGDSYDPWWRWTLQDNPPHLLGDFAAWVESEGMDENE